MPFTPFHMGLGFAGKQALHKYMSLQLFALSQILIDLEPLALLRMDFHPCTVSVIPYGVLL